MESPVSSIGNRIAHLSLTLLPKKDFHGYCSAMGECLDDNVIYIDPVHELNGKEAVVKMLTKYLPRVANEHYKFNLLVDTENLAIWRWKIGLKIRFTPFLFIIHGLVYAEIKNGRIVYQREYYDPMESIGVIPLVGFLYKMVLKFG